MLRKKTRVGLALGMVLFIAILGGSRPAEAEVQTVPEETWAEPYYYWLIQRGILSSEEYPSNFVSRKQLLIILLKEMGLEKRAALLTFKNLAEEENFSIPPSWEGFYKTAAETGILASAIDGMAVGGELFPSSQWWEQPAERGWAVKVFLSSLAETKKKEVLAAAATEEVLPAVRLSDAEKIRNDWKPWVLSAQKLGIVDGYPDHSFRADSSLTVAELTVLIGKIHEVLGSGSLIVEGKTRAIYPQGDGFSVELIMPGGEKSSYWAATGVPVWGKDKTTVASLFPGCEIEIFLHNNREIAAVKLINPSVANQIASSSTVKKENRWQDIADILVVESRSFSALLAFESTARDAAPETLTPADSNSYAFFYHNLYPFYGPLTVAFDGSRYWVGNLFCQEIYLFDSQGVHRQTIVLPYWLKGDSLIFKDGNIWLVDMKTTQAYRLKPVFFEVSNSLIVNPTVSPTLKISEAERKMTPPSYCLLYVGGAGKEKLFRYRKEDLIPLVAYQDPQGNIRDFFFDGFVMLAQYSPLLNGKPLSADLPESKTAVAEIEDWEALFREYFAPNFNLRALEEATKETAAVLDQPAYKVEVFLGIPTPSPLASSFSDLGSCEGLELPFEVVEKGLDTPQVYAVWWAMQEVKQRFQEAGFKHLVLAGFYYQTEQGWPTDKVQTAFPLLCRTLGLHSMAIPGVTSSFPLEFCEVGFDVVLLQSSHVFVDEPPRSPYHHLQLALSAGEEDSPGIMVEAPFAYHLTNNQQKFMENLALLEHPVYRLRPRGCFQSFDLLRQWATSSVPSIRKLYDQLYKALKMHP